MFFASLVPEIFLHYLINALISEERPNVQNREDNWVWHLESIDKW